MNSRADFLCELGIIKIIPKTTNESCRPEKTVVELTMMEGSRNQEVDIFGENMLLLLYTRFLMSVGIGI